jgi:5-methyltetrahydrofolate--homocysteine methyltransferase
MSEEIIKQFKEAIVIMDIDSAKKTCKDALAKGVEPFKIIQDGIVEAVKIVGERFEAEEYFLPELIMAGEIITKTMEILEPHIKSTSKSKGKVVIGTGKGDMHDIGKNIVITFMKAEGFEVIDLGVDVSIEKFIQTIRNENPEILAISALVSSTMPEVEYVMKALNKEGLRDKVKVIIGGAPITQDFVNDIGADGYARDAIDGIKICKEWIGS